LLVVSHAGGNFVNPYTGYNTQLTVTSYSGELNQEIYDKFQQQTGISLDLPVPDELAQQFRALKNMFKMFEGNSTAAMEFFKRV
jgi:hypothetical protein